MKRIYLVIMVLVLTSCSTQDKFYSNITVPEKSNTGYSRAMFPNRYLQIAPPMPVLVQQWLIRENWNPIEHRFKELYPNFNVNLIAFNNYGGRNNFSWQERIMFADALELVVMSVNHPIFLEEMKKNTFYDNTGTTKISVESVVNHIRKSSLNIYLVKDSLNPSVYAQATLGGVSHTIWFRNDNNYQNHDVIQLAIILAHELTHNLGYTHESNVPYGVHDPVEIVINQLGSEDAKNFINNTPYYEDDFISRVRSISTRFTRSVPVEIIQN